MQKGKDARIREAQGQKSKAIANRNQLLVFLTLVEKPLNFSELVENTGFSRPVLAKHLKNLQKIGSIEKDTIKLDETSNPEQVGKVVYKVRANQVVPDIVRAIERALQMPKPNWDDESKAELYRHYEGIARILMKQWEKLHSVK
jgi:DNA-binding HxlR family transcriptional regulator